MVFDRDQPIGQESSVVDGCSNKEHNHRMFKPPVLLAIISVAFYNRFVLIESVKLAVNLQSVKTCIFYIE